MPDAREHAPFAEVERRERRIVAWKRDDLECDLASEGVVPRMIDTSVAAATKLSDHPQSAPRSERAGQRRRRDDLLEARVVLRARRVGHSQKARYRRNPVVTTVGHGGPFGWPDLGVPARIMAKKSGHHLRNGYHHRAR